MNMLTIEVAYATPEKQLILTVQVPEGTTVQQCIEQSGIVEHFAEIDLSQQKVGIWNKAAKLDATPRDGDRIEIYRPLIADPKAVRKRRAERAKEEGRADKVTGGRPDTQRRQRSKE
ncbi:MULTISPECIES: RnfH family protein [Idiomarina]|jgi:putative ubiquitin-RnfH superfamily antitoxin RatB of RatAB toxin-antitoxin module